MKKIILTAAAFIFCASAAISLDEEKYSKFRAVQSIESDFATTNYIITDKVVSEMKSGGKFYFEKPGFLRWEYTVPATLVHGIMLKGGEAYKWKVLGGKKKVEDVSKNRFTKIMAEMIYMFVSMDMDAIGKMFKAEEFEGGINLIPRSEKDQTMEKITLLFNEDYDAVVRVTMLEKAGDKTIIDFSSTILNSPVPAEAKEP